MARLIKYVGPKPGEVDLDYGTGLKLAAGETGVVADDEAAARMVRNHPDVWADVTDEAGGADAGLEPVKQKPVETPEQAEIREAEHELAAKEPLPTNLQALSKPKLIELGRRMFNMELDPGLKQTDMVTRIRDRANMRL